MKSQLLIRFRIILNESIMILKQQYEHAYSSEKNVFNDTIASRERFTNVAISLHLFTTTQNQYFLLKYFFFPPVTFSMAFKETRAAQCILFRISFRTSKMDENHIDNV